MPDDNFERALINLGYDDVLDNLVLTANINTVVSLNVSNESISSLVGIEDFTALENLDCSTNGIESLDLYKNTALLELNVSNNVLSTFDISTNTALTTMYVANNLLKSIDLSNNTELIILNCSGNLLKDLEVSGNAMLNDLDCSFNQIERLNVISNVGLVSLLCTDNNLFALTIKNGNNNLMTTFNATNNVNLFCIEVDDLAIANTAIAWQKDATAVYSLNCGTYVPDDNFEQALIDLGIDSDTTLNNFVATADINALTLLDISGLEIEDLTGIEGFENLQDLNCSNNNLTNLDLSNNLALQTLDASNNQIIDLDLTVNTALIALLFNSNALRSLNIKNNNNGILANFNATNNPNLYCINVDDAIVGAIPTTWQIDTSAAYNGDCANNRFTTIPDAFFEQALIDLNYDDVIDGKVLTSNIEQILNLDISDRSISNLTGIQDFKSLIELNCSNNFLNALNVSGMLFLERLNCNSNYLLTNNVNDINGLFNTTGTLSLTELYCSGNNLNNLDTSQNSNLRVLDCSDNNLSLLNINNNALLRILNCSNNKLTSLDLSDGEILIEVNCDSNEISNLVTSDILNTTLTTLSCANNKISSLLVDNYEALTTLNSGSNQLTQLDVLNNTVLRILSVSNNQISEINLLNNTSLEQVILSQNKLSQLDVVANTLLENLDCAFNDIAQLDLNSNILLKFLNCSNNELAELDLDNTTNLIEADFSSNNITILNLGTNLGALKRINASNNQIEDDIDLSTMATSACVSQPSQTEFCPDTVTINVSNNLLSFVNIQNGANSDIANFNASANPNLTCIQVDDTANIGAGWLKDNFTTYSEDCNFGETFVPDDNFEQALIDLGFDVGPLNDYVLTSNIQGLINLDVSGNVIEDLTGIEDFIALETLNCSNNALSELDLILNVNLVNVDCSNNVLVNLVVENNSVLNQLNCSSNSISSLNLGSNTNLTDLNIAENAFTVFLPSEVLSLEVLNCDSNSIKELNFQQNQSLTSLTCQSNILEILNVRNGQNSILSNLNAQNNPSLICVETDDGTVPNGASWNIDVTAQFAVDCFFGQTFVPDDNFEQALIDLGYDSGSLDDYVFTENIEDVNVLNIVGREISDLTGVEAFTSIRSLDVAENMITTLDLSANTLLVNLDVSGNLLTDLDLSVLSNLTRLNVSNNSLESLDLDSNLSLVDLNVSNNILSILEVDVLLNLEELNCASNQLSSINVTRNTNLTLLFCQSNSLIADQLNIQNGSNENLQLFNASNNPDLACILVDNPVAVISNEEGIYDNWIKDSTASYKTVCEDADNDGVPNEDDLCPSTEFGATVDLFGCAIINLPFDNFTISITSETCLNSNNGKITITANEIYNYTVSLISGDFKQDYNFTNDIDIFNLLAGTYEMCITIEEWPDYRSCYTIVITQPDPLEVFSSQSASGTELSVVMSGNSSYHVEFNGESFTTYNPVLALELQQGTNTLKVSTDLECQGVYEESIIRRDGPFVYPNPFDDSITIYLGSEGEDISINIYTMFGQLVIRKSFVNQVSDKKIDTNELPNGMYLVRIESKSLISTFKIIKE